jgi:hypothetical protein
MAAKQVTLDDLINSLDPEIKALLKEDTRDVLDKRPTILDISYKSLLVNKYDTVEQFKELHDTLLTIVRENAKNVYSSIEAVPRSYFQKKGFSLLYINGGPDVQLLIGSSVDPIRKFLSNKVSKDFRLADTIFGLRKEETPILNRKQIPTGDFTVRYISKIDIGHVATEGEMSNVAVSPLSYKLLGLIDYGEMTGSPVLQYATEALNKLYALQADIDYSFKNKVPEVIGSGTQALGDLFVVVTIHTSTVNQAFSDEEKQIFFDLRRKIGLLASKKLRDNFLMGNIEGSNTVLQDIEQALVSILKTGKANLTKHSAHKGKSKKEQINSDKKAKTTGKISTKVNNTKGTAIAPPSNLLNITRLINSQLQDVISANMGDGSSKNILNYRTGRFASTVKVENMTMSREGMITAFYSYMKNPYATFSTGGRQSIPKSRDPKLLISSSIREIAEQVVTNRLRAVAL